MVGSPVSITALLKDWPLQGFIILFPLLLFFIVSLVKTRRADALLASGYAVGVWIGTSYFIRYAHFAALAAVCAGQFLDLVIKKFKTILWFPKNRHVLAGLAVFLLIGPNLNVVRYVKSNFDKPIPLNQASWEKFYRYFNVSSMELIKKLPQMGIKKGTIYTLGYLHLKCYYEREGFSLIGYHVNSGLRYSFEESVKKGFIPLFLKSAGANSATIRKESLRDYGLKESDVLKSIERNEAVAIVYNDANSLVIKVKASA